jgi:hypothetical protein
LKKYAPRGIRNQGRPLKRLLDDWDRQWPTSLNARWWCSQSMGLPPPAPPGSPLVFWGRQDIFVRVIFFERNVDAHVFWYRYSLCLLEIFYLSLRLFVNNDSGFEAYFVAWSEKSMLFINWTSCQICLFEFIRVDGVGTINY